MYKRRLAVLTATLAVTFTALTGTASAALLSDLTALGYTIGIAWATPNPAGGADCTVYTISGYGISTYANSCDPDFQATIDSIAAGHCERKWQYEHPDQLDAWTAIARLGWTTRADKCADVFTITDPNDGTVRYSGPGSGLVELALTIGTPPIPPPPPAPPATPAPQPEPQPVVAATPNPAPAAATEPVTTAPTATITLTPAQLQQIIDRAVAKALKRERARAKAAAARAPQRARASSHLKTPARPR